MNHSSKILITGATGLVGRFAAGHLGSVQLFTPARHEMDITDSGQVHNYIGKYTPDVIIHSAAFTDNTEAERQRGNKKGMCWKVNVEGTKNIVEAGKRYGAYIIFISTGSVFAGDRDNPGPFTEDDPSSPDKHLSWYGATKKEAEKLVRGGPSNVPASFDRGAIIRLSHPVARQEIFDIPPQDTIEAPRPHLDYVQHLVRLFDERALYPLFTDQHFPITYLDDVVIVIKQLLATKKTGIFHVVSFDETTPHELAKAAIERARHVQPELARTTFDEFITTQKYPLRFSKYSAITGAKTAQDLHLPVRTWKEIVDCLYGIRKV
jgi:dTDP-4-dehydrorhamnose reductase